jgi:hypothetical protein
MNYSDIPETEREKLEVWFTNYSSKLSFQHINNVNDAFPTYSVETLYAMLSHGGMITLKCMDTFLPSLEAHSVGCMLIEALSRLMAVMGAAIMINKYEKDLVPDTEELNKLWSKTDDRVNN